MKKRLFTFLMALVMTVSMAVPAFAAVPSSNVAVAASVGVRESGSGVAWSDAVSTLYLPASAWQSGTPA